MGKARRFGSNRSRSFRDSFWFSPMNSEVRFLRFFSFISICIFSFIGIGANPSDSTQSRQECLNVPDCVSVPVKELTLKGKESVLLLPCPANAPFLWNWDAERSRDISITQRGESPRHVLLHIIDNNTKDPSKFKIFLGCSSKDSSGRTVKFTHSDSGEPVDRVAVKDTVSEKGLQSLQGVDPPNPCTAEMQNCTVVTTDTIALPPWNTKAFDVTCPPQTPYYRAWSAWRSSDWIGNYYWGFWGNGNWAHFTATNWDPGQTHGTRVSIACSTTPHPLGCYQKGTKEDGCTIIDGTSEIICPDEKCFTVWKLQCPDGTRWDCDTLWFAPCCRPPVTK